MASPLHKYTALLAPSSSPASSPKPAAGSSPASVVTENSVIFTDHGLARALAAATAPTTAKGRCYLEFAAERMAVLESELASAQREFSAIEDERIMGERHSDRHAMALNCHFLDANNALNKAKSAVEVQREGIAELQEMAGMRHALIDDFSEAQTVAKLRRQDEEKAVLAREKQEYFDAIVENEELKDALTNTRADLHHAEQHIFAGEAHVNSLVAQRNQVLNENETLEATRNEFRMKEAAWKTTLDHLRREVHVQQARTHQAKVESMEINTNLRNEVSIKTAAYEAEKVRREQLQFDLARASAALMNTGGDRQLEYDLGHEMNKNTELHGQLATQKTTYDGIIETKDSDIHAEVNRNAELQQELDTTKDMIDIKEQDLEIWTKRNGALQQRVETVNREIRLVKNRNAQLQQEVDMLNHVIETRDGDYHAQAVMNAQQQYDLNQTIQARERELRNEMTRNAEVQLDFLTATTQLHDMELFFGDGLNGSMDVEHSSVGQDADDELGSNKSSETSKLLGAFPMPPDMSCQPRLGANAVVVVPSSEYSGVSTDAFLGVRYFARRISVQSAETTGGKTAVRVRKYARIVGNVMRRVRHSIRIEDDLGIGGYNSD